MENLLNLNKYGVAEMQCAEMEQAEGGTMGDITGYDSWYYDSKPNASDKKLVKICLLPIGGLLNPATRLIYGVISILA